MSTVYVLNKDGKPLMPTTRCGHVRYLLKEKKARVVKTKPFTIQLLYETNDVVQPLYLSYPRQKLPSRATKRSSSNAVIAEKNSKPKSNMLSML